MRYLQIYENFNNVVDYKEFGIFDYKTCPKFSDFQIISKSIYTDVEKVLENLGWLQLFNFRSKLEITDFYMLDWPIYLKTHDDDIIESDEWQQWCNDWKKILDKTWKKDDILKNKCLKFECKIDKIHYKQGSPYHRVSIIKDNDDYYYVSINLQGEIKHFKCDQEYGLEKCLKTELTNKKID